MAVIGESCGGILPSVGMKVVVTVDGMTISCECVTGLAVWVTVLSSVEITVVLTNTVLCWVTVTLSSMVEKMVSVTEIVAGPLRRSISALLAFPTVRLKSKGRYSKPWRRMFAELCKDCPAVYGQPEVRKEASLLINRREVVVGTRENTASKKDRDKWLIL